MTPLPGGVGATILGVAGPALDADEAAFLRDADPFGFILFARNVETPAQLRRLTGTLRDAVGRDAPVFVDQEGGRVARLRAPHWHEWAAPLDAAEAAARSAATTGEEAAGQAAARAVWLRYRLIAAELRAVGIDGNCAPCTDIAFAATHPFLRNRCLGLTPQSVAERAAAAIEAHLAGGVLPVVKHVPGHGRAAADSHLALPRVDAPRAALAESDFAVLSRLAAAPLAMTAHVVFDAVDPDRPATLSPAVIALMRNGLGLSGLLMTDDIGMGALSGPVAARAAAAVAAGCDIVLECSGDRDRAAAVAAAAGRLSGAAAVRAAAALAERRTPAPVDIGALASELRALTQGCDPMTDPLPAPVPGQPRNPHG